MTPEEFEYIKRAMAAIETGEYNKWTEVKILRTVSQICGKRATDIEQNLIGEVDAKIQRNYQDLQNQKLVDILSR